MKYCRLKSKSRESGGPSSPCRSGEGASSPSAAPDGEGGDERMRHRRSEVRGGGSPPSGEETAVRPERRCMKESRLQWIPRRLLLMFRGDVQAASKAYAEEESIKQNDGTFLKEGCLDDEQHSDEIGARAIESHEREQVRARGHVQALLDMDRKTIVNKICDRTIGLNFGSDEPVYYPPDYCPQYEEEELFGLYEKLALYRIKAYELTVDRKLDKLDDASLKLEYPPSKLRANGFFKHYEESLEWYFDLERCKDAYFDNYQRLVLHGDRGYVDWDFYTSVFVNTYEQDLAFVRYFEAVAKQTKWIENYLGDSTIQWEGIKDVAYMQALEIAAGFPDVSPLLITYCFPEYICSIKYDYDRKGLDDLYFEIWKRVAKGKMSYKEALFEIHKKDMIPLRRVEIKNELENTLNKYPVKKLYDAHVAGIDKMTPDDEAHELIKEAVVKIKSSKSKYYLDYAKRKLDIAKEIDLIP